MDQNAIATTETGLAAHAFGELRAELSLLRRAIERLTDERTAQPDYAPSLEAIGKRLEDVCGWARRISDTPALQLTPEGANRQIIAAAESSRLADRDMMQRAAQSMDATVARIDAMTARSRSDIEQNRELRRNRIAFAIAGIVLCAILPGAIARSLPISWAVPQRMAARMLGTDMWHAGQTMMARADPEQWLKIVARQRQSKRPPERQLVGSGLAILAQRATLADLARAQRLSEKDREPEKPSR